MNSFAVLATSALLYWLVEAIYRVFYHPLASLPGPKLAAMSWWYITYYEVFRDGGLLEHLETLHAQYGPVVRIGPNELHFNDRRDYGTIYTHGSKFTKDSKFYAAFHEEDASFGAIDPRVAKARRDAMGPLFSRRGVLKLERFIQQTVDNLVTQMRRYGSSERPVDVHRAFRSASLDIILSYCFAREYGVVDTEDFAHPILLGYEATFPMCLIVKHFPWVFPLLVNTRKLITFFKPQYHGHGDVRGKVTQQIDELLLHPESLEKEEHETIYHHLLSVCPEKGQTKVPSRKSLVEEAINLLAAGGDTTGNACTIGTFYILSDDAVHARLFQELKTVWPEQDNSVAYEVLEKLPYLTAVIKESLRMSHGVVAPLPRVVGPSATVIAGHSIPAGTVVAMGATFVHYDPEVFPDPKSFNPDRWLQPNAQELENFLVPFSRGPRSCLGVNLAWCELYMFFANVFRKFDMRLHDTSIEDLKFRTHLTPTYRGRHVKVLVNERQT